MADYTKLALEIVKFLKKWNLWEGVKIYTGGWCYSVGCEDDVTDGISGLCKEPCSSEEVDIYTSGIVGRDCYGNIESETFANPAHLLDMTFMGPLSTLLNKFQYGVDLNDLPEETKEYLKDELQYILVDSEEEDRRNEEYFAYMERKNGWDPMIFDSYEEYLELERGDALELDDEETEHVEFASREEYQDFIERSIQKREQQLLEELYFDTEDCEVITPKEGWLLAEYIHREFIELLECYGLWYEQGFSWTLTTYRKGE